jgi:hypothetical protein
MMTHHFEMSMIDVLNYFIGIQVKQIKIDTFMNQGKLEIFWNGWIKTNTHTYGDK